MSDNLPNIELPSNEWVDLYAVSGVAVGTALSVENIGVCDVYLAVQATEPAVDHEAYNIVQRGNGIRLQNNENDPGAWAFCRSNGGKVSVIPQADTGFYPHSTVDLKTGGYPIDVQHPLPTDGDSVYCKDIWPEESITTGWVDADGAGGNLICIPFNNLHTALRNTTTDNPKILRVHFNRTVSLDQVGIGCAEHPGENFSNVMVKVLGSGGVERTVLDESGDNTKYTSRNYQFGPELGNAVDIEFHTTDPVCISNITIQKVTKTSTQIKAVNDDGVVVNIGATSSGNLKTTDAESGLAIAQGLVAGTSAVQKFGNAPDFGSGDGQVTVWDGAQDGTDWELMRYVYSTTADIDSVSSSSAADTQDIVVVGLDENYNEVVQSITLNGQTRVAIPIPLIRVYRAYNNNSINLNGHVIVYVNGPLTGGVPDNSSDIRAIVDPNNQQTEMCVYTVPAGKTGYLVRGYASTSGANRNSNYVIRFLGREAGKVFRLQNINAISDTGNSIIVLDYFVPLRIPEKTDLEVTVEATASPITGASVSAGFDLVLVDN